MTSTTLDRRTATLLAVAMPLGPLCVAALRALMPTFTAGTARETALAVAGSPARQNATVWLGTIALLLLAPGVLGAARLTRQSAPRLTWWAVGLLFPAYTMVGFLVAGDAAAWSTQAAHLGTPAATSFFGHQHPATVVGLAVFVVGHVVGTVLLGLALLRSRQVHPSFAWGLAVSQPVHFVAYVILQVRALDVCAWGLTTLGMAAAAVALVRAERSAELSQVNPRSLTTPVAQGVPA